MGGAYSDSFCFLRLFKILSSFHTRKEILISLREVHYYFKTKDDFALINYFQCSSVYLIIDFILTLPQNFQSLCLERHSPHIEVWKIRSLKCSEIMKRGLINLFDKVSIHVF